MSTTYTARFVAAQRAARPAEAAHIRRILAALSAHGFTVDRLDDGEEVTPVVSVRDVLDLAFNLDEWVLYCTNGGWIRVVMGEDPQDMIVDYSMSLDPALRRI